MKRQGGSSLIEVLVTVLILSFGMLSLSGMLAYAVQLPKMSAYRASAVRLANAHVEKMRANIDGFVAGGYDETMTFNQTITGTTCTYPSCDSAGIADKDQYESNLEIRRALPQGGMRMVCNGGCTSREGDVWVMWEEPSTFASIDPTAADECPDPTAAPTFTFAVQPRCVHLRFKL